MADDSTAVAGVPGPLAGRHTRPRIAVPGRFSTNASALRSRALVGSRSLLDGVYAAGGDPLVVLPSAPGGEVTEAEVSDRLSWADGILLPGGGDLAAHWSGQPDHEALYDVDVEQDAFDLTIARWALRIGLPVLAICRGSQVVNVALGGTLVQHMDERGGPIANHRNHVHHVSTTPGSRMASVVGSAVEVSCYHHQCIDNLADGLVATAHSEEGVVEGVEIPSGAGWFLGTQWHPEDTWTERPEQLAVFEAFVAACRL